MIRNRAPAPQAANRGTIPDFAALLAWIDSLGATGLDGRDLSELGLKNGNLTVDRSAQRQAVGPSTTSISA